MKRASYSTCSKPRLARLVASLALLTACNGSARHSPQAAESDGETADGSTRAEPSTTAGGSGGSSAATDATTTFSDASTATSAGGGANSDGANGVDSSTSDGGASDGGNAQGSTSQGANTGSGGAGAGGGGATLANTGGAGQPDVEVAACVTPQAIDRLRIYYSDRTLGVCTMIVFQQGQVCGSSGVDSSGSGWCYEGTVLSADVDACSARMNPADPVGETQASGTLAASGDVVDIDIQLTFPEDADLPHDLHVVVENCTADCGSGDCR
jgi:hypothetical protein